MPSMRRAASGRCRKSFRGEEIDALIDAARVDMETSDEAMRLLCMLEILYASGLRVSELVTLPLAAVRNRETIFCARQGRQGTHRAAESRRRARRSRTYLDVRDGIPAAGAARERLPSVFCFPRVGARGISRGGAAIRC